MQGFSKSARFGFALLFACFAFVTGLRAEDSVTFPASTPEYTFSVRAEPVPGMKPVYRTYVTAGTNKFTFVVPNGFRVDSTKSDKIVFLSTDYGCFLSVGIIRQPLAVTPENQAKPYRDLLLSRYGEVNILEEFSRNVADLDGPAFDLEWKNTAGVRQFSRETFIPFGDGVLEFNVITSPALFPRFQHDFNSLLSTFRAGKNGQFEVVRVSSGSV